MLLPPCGPLMLEKLLHLSAFIPLSLKRVRKGTEVRWVNQDPTNTVQTWWEKRWSYHLPALCKPVLRSSLSRQRGSSPPSGLRGGEPGLAARRARLSPASLFFCSPILPFLRSLLFISAATSQDQRCWKWGRGAWEPTLPTL